MTLGYDDSKCNLYHKNSSDNSSIFHIQNPYGGIPQNLLTNLIGLSILVVLFLLLRKSAWKVLNKIVRRDELDRWTHIFFNFSAVASAIQNAQGRPADVATQQIPAQEVSAEPEHVDLIHPVDEDLIEDGDRDSEEREERQRIVNRSMSLVGEGTFCDWLKSIFTMPDEDIEDLYGTDALQYLRFQRYTIGYLLFVMVICISVILPLNFMGDLQGDESSFGHTTLANLTANSDILWAHISLSFLLFPVAILVMRRFSVDVEFQEVGLEMNKTLMVEKVPKYMCKEVELKRHFSEAFPGITVKKVTFAYDVNKLLVIYQQLKDAYLALDYCKRHDLMKREPFHVYRANCSRCCSCVCCCCSQKVEATEYYSGEVNRLSDAFFEEKALALKRPVGVVFVTFATLNNAKEVFDAFRRSVLQCSYEPPHSSLSEILKPKNWKVSFATTPDDIYWENLSVSRRFLTLKYTFINVALFLIAFFLTTPEYLVSQTDWLVMFFGKTLQLPSYIVDFLPTLLLWSFTALLPLLVAYSDRWLGHYTRSEENHSIMKKTFWYLLFMVIILPTFGFTTAQASFEFLFNTNKNETYRWECIFLPDSGAFFVNYVITAALVGTGLELIRFPEMFWYFIQICWSKSRADTPAIRRGVRYEFRFGEQYARMMLLFCMTMMFCVSCPLITPFGCLYFIAKHYVDRHNILYAYKPSKINKHVHATAISFVILSTVVLQFFMTIFSVVRSGAGIYDLSLRSKFAIGLFLLSVNIFSAQLWSDTCKKFSPIEYMECTLVREQDLHRPDYVYLPNILQDDVAVGGHLIRRSKPSTTSSNGQPPGAATENHEEEPVRSPPQQKSPSTPHKSPSSILKHEEEEEQPLKSPAKRSPKPKHTSFSSDERPSKNSVEDVTRSDPKASDQVSINSPQRKLTKDKPVSEEDYGTFGQEHVEINHEED